MSYNIYYCKVRSPHGTMGLIRSVTMVCKHLINALNQLFQTLPILTAATDNGQIRHLT